MKFQSLPLKVKFLRRSTNVRISLRVFDETSQLSRVSSLRLVFFKGTLDANGLGCKRSIFAPWMQSFSRFSIKNTISFVPRIHQSLLLPLNAAPRYTKLG